MSGQDCTGNWREAAKRPILPMRLIYRLRRSLRRRRQLIRWAAEQAAYGEQQASIKQQASRRKVLKAFERGAITINTKQK